MQVIETIDRLSDLAVSMPFRRKTEACFLLVSKIVPFHTRYVEADILSRVPFHLRDHILFLWSLYCVGSTVSAQDALQLESRIPDMDRVDTPGGRLADDAQNAVVCALHLTWYLATRDDAYVKGCVVNYFDHVDNVALEKIGVSSGVPELTDMLVARSQMFRREAGDFEAALLKDGPESIASRPLLIANMDRDVSDNR